MAGIYSQGGSAGHRYAGWLETVEAKNFQFGSKVFNGSPSAIYVGSNLVWAGRWLTVATAQAILGAFGQTDGKAVINATNAYLNQLAASGQAGKDKATALAGFINTYAVEDAHIVYSLIPTLNVYRRLNGDGTAYIETGHIFAQNEGERYVKFKVTAQSANYRYWGSYRGGQGRSMMAYPPTGKLMLGIGDGTNPDYQTNVTITVGSVYEVWMTAEGTTANYKVWKDGTLAEQGTYTYGKSIVVQDTEPIFCDKENGTHRYPTPFDLEQFETKESGEYTQKLIPFVLGTARTAEQCSPQVACAVGTIGLLNLADGIFMPNANSTGSFTISETPSTP